MAQGHADRGDAFGVFATFREFRIRGSSAKMGEVQPAEAQRERDAWAEHFRKIGQGAGDVKRIRFGLMSLMVLRRSFLNLVGLTSGNRWSRYVGLNGLRF